MSERPGSNRPPRPWQGRALPNELLSQLKIVLKNFVGSANINTISNFQNIDLNFISNYSNKWIKTLLNREFDLLIYCPKIQANINGATIVASLSTINLGVLISNLPQVIFSFGTAPLYEPYEVVESEI